ncbi:Tryptophan-specific transport protein [Marinobacter litoralis]|uniref:Aromatic amino acid permease n=1 Tax=Marinobacter litoralis TaxID=187981 RepID=A0A3M2RGE9_9GAMM|nr:aromatic amino acid transporter [Marinobacter litoralis]RMJ04390.1 Tryptophan-specific transport protein [Marinobacter litoralis]
MTEQVKSKPVPSLIGGASIIASVCVGAGMLGLPSSGAGAWTVWSSLALVLTMVVMTLSGWMLLEAFKHFDLRASFNTVTKSLLGARVNVFSNLTVYFVGGILLYAYITSSGLIIQSMTGVDSKLASVAFVLLFSLVVWHSTRAVDRLSVVLVTFMLLSFVLGVFGLAARIDLGILFDAANVNGQYAPYAMAMLPVALTSFGYHHSVASLRAYYGEERKAQKAIVGGTAVALTFYLVWLLSIFGNLPRASFGPVVAQGGDVDVLLAALGFAIDSERVANTISAFSTAAILSSFVGVGLGTFDFMADLLGFKNDRKGRTKTWAITFVPPLLLSLLAPFGFVLAIGYAGAAAAVWACIVPALLARKSRMMEGGYTGFMAPGGKAAVILVLVFGVLTIVFHFMGLAGWLPEAELGMA